MQTAPVIAVLGAGSWGTALAILLSRNGAEVRLWSFDPDQVVQLNRAGENSLYLPGIQFPDGLIPTSDLAAAVNGVEEVLIAVPSHAFRHVLEMTVPFLSVETSLSWATKGLDPQSGRLLHTVVKELLPNCSIAVISGPSFATEVARGLPTAITAAASTPAHTDRLSKYLHSDNFRLYKSSDIIGLEVGGAAKNIMAIAAGIADGLGFGANTRAALITRGLAEIMRLGQALGGRQETFMGLAGMGDLILTCTDDQSRNRQMGLALARGLTTEQAKKLIGQEVEGVATTREIYNKAKELKIEMPITEQTYQVLYMGREPGAAVRALLKRSQRTEM